MDNYLYSIVRFSQGYVFQTILPLNFNKVLLFRKFPPPNCYFSNSLHKYIGLVIRVIILKIRSSEDGSCLVRK